MQTNTPGKSRAASPPNDCPLTAIISSGKLEKKKGEKKRVKRKKVGKRDKKQVSPPVDCYPLVWKKKKTISAMISPTDTSLMPAATSCKKEKEKESKHTPLCRGDEESGNDAISSICN